MSSENEQDLKKSNKNIVHLGLDLVVTMLITDKVLIAFYYAMTVIPSIILTLYPETENNPYLLELANRAIHLGILYHVGSNWYRSFGFTASNSMSSLQFIGYGFLYWMILIIPITLSFILPAKIGAIALACFLPALFISLRYYFYFIPLLAGEKNLKDVARKSSELIKDFPFLAIQTLVAPLGIMLVISSLILSISPDGRSLEVMLLVDIANGSFSILSIYLSLAFGFSLLKNKSQPTNSKIDKPKSFLAQMLAPKRGYILILVGALIAAGNNIRSETTKPSPKIDIEYVQLLDNNITIGIYLRDEDYNFQAFRPSFFRLSGNTGKDIGLNFPQVRTENQKLNTFQRISTKNKEIQIELVFDLDKSKENYKSEDFKKAEDVSLWYRGYKVSNIDIVDSTTLDKKVSNTSSSVSKEVLTQD